MQNNHWNSCTFLALLQAKFWRARHVLPQQAVWERHWICIWKESFWEETPKGLWHKKVWEAMSWERLEETVASWEGRDISTNFKILILITSSFICGLQNCQCVRSPDSYTPIWLLISSCIFWLWFLFTQSTDQNAYLTSIAYTPKLWF